jgi:transposase, IS5 family
VLDGNPIDEQHVVISLVRHRQTFGDVPNLYGSDRGFFSEKKVMPCKQQRAKVVCIPRRGGSKAPERQAYERTGSSGRASAFTQISRGASRCCSAVAA